MATQLSTSSDGGDNDSWDWNWNNEESVETMSPVTPGTMNARDDGDNSWICDTEAMCPVIIASDRNQICLETLSVDGDDSQAEATPSAEQLRDDAIDMFPSRPIATIHGEQRPEADVLWNHEDEYDDDIETQAIPIVEAVQCEEASSPHKVDDNFDSTDMIMMASLVDSNDPATMRTFQAAPTAQRAAVDISSIPKKGVGWTAGFERDFTKNVLHMILLMIGSVLLLQLNVDESRYWALGWYGVFLFEALCSSYGRSLSNMSNSSNVLEYLNHLRRSAPCLWLSMTCYHYETRTQYFRDKDGKSHVTTVTYRVDTFVTKEPVTILSCRDATQNIPTEADLKEYQVTTVNLTKSFIADSPFKEQVHVFRARYASRDLHYEMKIHYEIPNFTSHVMSYTPSDDDNETFLQVSWGQYMLAHLLILPALYYRLWLSSRSCNREVHVEKHILTAGPSPEALREYEAMQNAPSKGTGGTVLSGLANLFLGRH